MTPKRAPAPRSCRPLLTAAYLLAASCGTAAHAAVPSPAKTRDTMRAGPLLQMRVTRADRFLTLGEILGQLGKQTGAHLDCASDIAGENAMAFVTDRPAAE